ncbi:peptidylprolyl isomerase [Traorella massiliensis]|uniref:foldase protein PrsA n=1 Tax=Traorella massiliensis TaxID=1903263 RepID=UPI0008F7FFE8|nr:peptidylprolyl isomerase [Traorella massiliensis]
MIEKLKENWFVVLVAVILIAAVGYYTYDTNKGKLPGKKVDGKDVVASIGDTDFFADDLYLELYGDESSSSSAGTQVLFSYFERAVVDAAVSVDDEMKTNIATAVTSVKQNYEGQESTLLSQLQAAGYSSLDDLELYFTHSFKMQKLIGDAYAKDLDNLFTPIYEEKNSRVVSHILVTISDFNNITEEEQAKMDAIDQALADGEDFAEVAKEYSDDGSASDGGNLGYVDSDSSLVTEFKEAALAAEKGVVTDWVQTEYGYHKILVTETDKEALMENEDIRNDIYAAIEKANPDLNAQIIWETGQELGVEFANENVENAIKSYLGIEDEK